MATPADVIRAMGDLHAREATKIAYKQTGIEPGFDPLSGITWTEDGRARYRRQGTALPFYASATIASAQTGITSTSYRIDFDTIESDAAGAITTGSSWQIALPIGVYIVTGWIDWKPQNNISGVGEYFDLVVYEVSGTPNQIDVLAGRFYDQAVSGTINTVQRRLTGSSSFYLASASLVGIHFNKPLSTARDIVGGRISFSQVRG